MLVTNLQLQLSSFLVWMTGLNVIRVSICMLYQRSFEKTLGSTLCIMYNMVCIVATASITLLGCRPTSALFDMATYASLEGTDQCVSMLIPSYFVGATNAIADLWLMALFVPAIWKLPRINQRERTVLLGIVSAGSLAIAAGLYRAVRFHLLLRSGDVDITWMSLDMIIATFVEINTTLACASMPCVLPLLRRVLPQFAEWLTFKRRRSYFISEPSQSSRETVGSQSVTVEARAPKLPQRLSQRFSQAITVTKVISIKEDDVEQGLNAVPTNAMDSLDGRKPSMSHTAKSLSSSLDGSSTLGGSHASSAPWSLQRTDSNQTYNTSSSASCSNDKASAFNDFNFHSDLQSSPSSSYDEPFPYPFTTTNEFVVDNSMHHSICLAKYPDDMILGSPESIVDPTAYHGSVVVTAPICSGTRLMSPIVEVEDEEEEKKEKRNSTMMRSSPFPWVERENEEKDARVMFLRELRLGLRGF